MTLKVQSKALWILHVWFELKKPHTQPHTVTQAHITILSSPASFPTSDQERDRQGF